MHEKAIAFNGFGRRNGSGGFCNIARARVAWFAAAKDVKVAVEVVAFLPAIIFFSSHGFWRVGEYFYLVPTVGECVVGVFSWDAADVDDVDCLAKFAGKPNAVHAVVDDGQGDACWECEIVDVSACVAMRDFFVHDFNNRGEEAPKFVCGGVQFECAGEMKGVVSKSEEVFV